MYSHLFCETLATCNLDPNTSNDDNHGIKLYKIELLKFTDLVDGLLNLLSISEINRADRYHYLKDRNRFIICRSLLKILLAEYLGKTIDKIILDIDSNKKPYLSAYSSVFFNVSHSGDYALIGISTKPIGVDIEFVNSNFNYEDILTNVFNPLEIDEVKVRHDNHSVFYKFWTRKEAIVKAIGKGIDDDLPKIPVTDGSHSIPLSLVGNFKQIHVISFQLSADYMGAIAYSENHIIFDKIIFHPSPDFDQLKSLIQKKN